jgi:hypothetical protein
VLLPAMVGVHVSHISAFHALSRAHFTRTYCCCCLEVRWGVRRVVESDDDVTCCHQENFSLDHKASFIIKEARAFYEYIF